MFACRKATETTKALANDDEKHTQHTHRSIFTYLFDPSNFYLFPSWQEPSYTWHIVLLFSVCGAGGLGRNTPLFLRKISQRDKAISSAILYTYSSKIHVYIQKSTMFNPYAENIRFPSVWTDHFSLFRFIPHRQILAGYIPHPKTSHTDRYLSSCKAMTGADLWPHSGK